MRCWVGAIAMIRLPETDGFSQYVNGVIVRVHRPVGDGVWAFKDPVRFLVARNFHAPGIGTVAAGPAMLHGASDRSLIPFGPIGAHEVDEMVAICRLPDAEKIAARRKAMGDARRRRERKGDAA